MPIKGGHIMNLKNMFSMVQNKYKRLLDLCSRYIILCVLILTDFLGHAHKE